MFPRGPEAVGSASGPYAWSDDPAGCLQAPAGLVRITGSMFTVYSGASDADNGSLVAAAGGMLGGGHYGAGAGWVRTDTGPDTLMASLSAATTLKGDPIGFMEGVFGPSISVGGTLGFISTDENDLNDGRMLSADVGFQFSLFPTVAIAAQMSGIRLAGDSLRSRNVNYGFSTVFDRRFRGHLSVSQGNPAVGFDLGVRDWLTVRSGSDGSSWNSGLSLEFYRFTLDWAVVLDDTDCRQLLGITAAFGGEP